MCPIQVPEVSARLRNFLGKKNTFVLKVKILLLIKVVLSGNYTVIERQVAVVLAQQ